jgi:hypothetical protein
MACILHDIELLWRNEREMNRRRILMIVGRARPLDHREAFPPPRFLLQRGRRIKGYSNTIFFFFDLEIYIHISPSLHL